MSILDILGKKLLFFDGAMGTVLQESGLNAGEIPEELNFTNEELILNIHKSYLKSGCDIITTNTFGANSFKMKGSGYSVGEIVKKAVSIAKRAVKEYGRGYVAFDMGSTGKLLKPFGEIEFEEAYDCFKEAVLSSHDADLIIIETMSDIYELKAAVLAAKENSSLPIFVTTIFDEDGKLLTGSSIKEVISLLEGLGVDAIGMNCGLGPNQMIKLLPEYAKYSSTPIIVQPNAGLPMVVNGETLYDIDADEFADYMEKIVELGASVIGGCCGTTTEHIKKMTDRLKNKEVIKIENKPYSFVSSYSKTVMLGNVPKVIGERINPTGKKKLKKALNEGDIDYILKEALMQEEKGADILDVNVGLPEIDEESVMERTVKEIQGVCSLPLQIDTTNKKALEKALRIYNGKAMINSVNGKEEEMEAIFPLVKKYGGVLVCLTLDENGIPSTAKGRIDIAKKIISRAEEYGIDKKDLIIDPLSMAISTDKENAVVTLEAVRYITEVLGANTCLGVSNISFGLPKREHINAGFFTMALNNGLSAGIINPSSDIMMNSLYSFNALMGYDENCENYINNVTNSENSNKDTNDENISLYDSVMKGMADLSKSITIELLKEKKPLEIIDEILIPALDAVGKGFEEKKIFLPKLLISSQAAKASFDAINEVLQMSGEVKQSKGEIIIATVKGDIHDIGKNIVKVLLENYGYDVVDLGKDVDIQRVVDESKKRDVKLVGLSALMTTTVVNMEKTIKKLKEKTGAKVMVGGAVLNEEYAKMINADYYAKDAMESVRIANEIFEK